VQDQFGNTVTSDTSNVTISSANTAFTGSTLTVAAASGVATFSVIQPTTAGTLRTLTAADGALTGATSGTFTVNAGAFTKLQILAPGETAAPGSATGKTGTPTAQTAGTAFNVTVNAVDANWNLVSSIHNVSI